MRRVCLNLLVGVNFEEYGVAKLECLATQRPEKSRFPEEDFLAGDRESPSGSFPYGQDGMFVGMPRVGT